MEIEHKKDTDPGLLLFRVSLTLIFLYILFIIADASTGGIGLPNYVRQIALIFAVSPIGFSFLGIIITATTYFLNRELGSKAKLGLVGNVAILSVYLVLITLFVLAMRNVPF